MITNQVEQIIREYKVKALQFHPDKNPDPESVEKFRLIQQAKDILTDESSRRSYDCWLNSRVNIPFEQWQGRKGHSIHWATPKSTKLSIKGGDPRGQGSDFKLMDESVARPDRDWLEKFRKYEI